MTAIREIWENNEAQILAPYAVFSANSNGRKFAENKHNSRACFARDRDRILHSRCFRRLEYKTQVFINGTDDHYRTRLTHTMEMAAVGRTLARSFHVNEDLTEAICLAHDIGHSPFGHTGEYALAELMKNHGGFDHNMQSLRWVEFLEPQYPNFNGLNLTWELRAGLLKHESKKPNAKLDGIAIGPFQSLEAQIADIADDISYYAHDVDDGLEAKLLTPELLETQKLWQLATVRTNQLHPNLPSHQHQRLTIRNLLDILVQDIMQSTFQNIRNINPQSVEEVMNAPIKIVDFSDEIKKYADDFRAFLYEKMYFSPTVLESNEKAVGMMTQLFDFYLNNPEKMGSKARARIETEGLHRTVCDYVSGFTDRYIFKEYSRHISGNETTV